MKVQVLGTLLYVLHLFVGQASTSAYAASAYQVLITQLMVSFMLSALHHTIAPYTLLCGS